MSYFGCIIPFASPYLYGGGADSDASQKQNYPNDYPIDAISPIPLDFHLDEYLFSPGDLGHNLFHSQDG
jgi:hypothetical protein